MAAVRAAGCPLGRAPFEVAPLGPLRLEASEVAVAVCARLGLPVLPPGIAIPCMGVADGNPMPCMRCERSGVTTEPVAMDRQVRICGAGGFAQAVHDGLRDVMGGVLLRWGVPVRLELRTRPGRRDKRRMDVSVPGAARDGGNLRIDLTRAEQVGPTSTHAMPTLDAKEVGKVAKYAGMYGALDEVRGFAVDAWGGCGPMAARVVRRLADLGARVTHRDGGELRRELWGALGVELVRRLTWLYEVAAHESGARDAVGGPWVPRVRTIRIVGGRRVVAGYGYDKRLRREVAAQT